MRFTLAVVTAPTAEPVTVDEAKKQLRIDDDTEDDFIDTLIEPARVQCETFTGRAFINTTFDYKLDRFPSGYERFTGSYEPAIMLPRPPLSSVTSITYTATDGTSTTLSSSLYAVDTAALPGRITPAYGESWPATRDIPNAVTVRFVAGYGSAATSVPANIKHAIKMLVAFMFEHRDDSVAMPPTIRDLLWSSKVLEIR